MKHLRRKTAFRFQTEEVCSVIIPLFDQIRADSPRMLYGMLYTVYPMWPFVKNLPQGELFHPTVRYFVAD